MDEKQFNELVEKFGEEMAKQISAKTDELTSGLITEDQLKTEVEELAKSSDIDEINKKMDEIGVNLKKMQEARKAEKAITLKDQLAANHEQLIKSVENPAIKGFKLDLKTNVTVGSITDDNEGFNLPGWNPPAHKGLVLPAAFRRVQVPANHHGTIYYTDQTTTTRNAAATAEAGTAPESAIGWTRRSLTLEKILDSIPLTYEAMNDIAELTGEVQRFIDVNIALAMQTQLWDGNGTAPNWYGIYSYATDFTQAIAQGLTGVQDANLADLITKIADYISNAKESKYTPDRVILNPRDLLALRLEKDANGNYIKIPYMNDQMDRILMMEIIECSEVDINTMVVGCSDHATFYDVDGITLEFGLDGNDFTQDLVTLKGRKRGNLLVKTADATSWYKVTNITQRITDITA
jgi:hypothetical protein